jgi:hypothetical protein
MKLGSDGVLSTYREASNLANGLLIDPQGRLIACEGRVREGERSPGPTGRSRPGSPGPSGHRGTRPQQRRPTQRSRIGARAPVDVRRGPAAGERRWAGRGHPGASSRRGRARHHAARHERHRPRVAVDTRRVLPEDPRTCLPALTAAVEGRLFVAPRDERDRAVMDGDWADGRKGMTP